MVTQVTLILRRVSGGEPSSCCLKFSSNLKNCTYTPTQTHIQEKNVGENPSLPYPYPSTASLHSSKFYQQLRVQSLILETLKYPGAASYTVQVPRTKGDGRQGSSLLRADNSVRDQAAAPATMTLLAKTLPFLSKGIFCVSTAGLLWPGEALKKWATPPAIFSFAGELRERPPRGTWNKKLDVIPKHSTCTPQGKLEVSMVCKGAGSVPEGPPSPPAMHNTRGQGLWEAQSCYQSLVSDGKDNGSLGYA